MTIVVKNMPDNAGDVRDTGSTPGSERPPGGGHSIPPSILAGEAYAQRSLAGYSPWCCIELYTTKVT